MQGRNRIALAAIIVAGLVAFLLTRPGIAPAGPAALVVNSTANTSDGTCDVTSCTLREAIDAANAGGSTVIQFDPATFPADTPGVIDLEGGEGALPDITADITIDNTGTGVVLDGDNNNDGTGAAGLKVNADHDDFSFDLEGDGHFTIEDIIGRAINVVGNAHGLDSLTIDGVTIANTTDDGIYTSGVTHAASVSVTGSTIDAGDVGIGTVVAGPDISSIDYTVTGNDIRSDAAPSTSGPAVQLNLQAALAAHSTVNFTVENNDRIEARNSGAVNLTLCSSSSQCALDSSSINYSVTGNTLVAGHNGVAVARIRGAPTGPGGTTNSSFTMLVNDNDTLHASGGSAVDVKSEICCDTGNEANISVDGNGTINSSEGDSGTDIRSGVCCDQTTGSTFDVSNNTTFTAGGGPAIGLEVDCCGKNSITIEDNTSVTSSGNHGIQIQNCITHEDAPAQDEADCITGGTQTSLLVTGNIVDGVRKDAVHICCGDFHNGDQNSVISNNTLTNSQRVGVDLNSVSGITVGPGNVISNNGSEIDEFPAGIRVNILDALLVYHPYSITLPSDGNTITENSISANGGPGIDLVGFSAAGNQDAPSEADLEYQVIGCQPFPPGPILANDCVPSPSLTDAQGGAVEGSTCAGCRVEVFSANDQPADQGDAEGDQHGEGETFLLAENASDSGSFHIALPCGLQKGLITVTVTDTGGNTSEFARNVPSNGTPICQVTPTPTSTATPAPPTPTPTHTTVPTATTPATLCGDVNGDRATNSIDSALILQYSAGLIQTFVAPQGGDVNHDGATNSIDAALILQYIAALLDHLSC